MFLDIVILPPLGLRQKIGSRIKRETTGHPSVFIVDNKKLIPHLSLWHMRTSKNRLNDVIRELKEVVEYQRPIKISSKVFKASSRQNGVISFAFKKTKPLSSLQRRIFRKTYPFKTGMMPPFKPIGIWTGKTLVEVKKYGRPMEFKAHMTMGLMKKHDDALEVAAAMRKAKLSFFATGIAVCEVNQWWQVTKVIKEIGFGNLNK